MTKSSPSLETSSSFDSPVSNSGDGGGAFSWTTSSELALFQTLAVYKPAGINKHFSMALAADRLSSILGEQVTSEAIWAKLRTMYDLAAVDDREEVIPFPLEEKEFSLARRDFGSLVVEKQRDILRDRALGKTKLGGVVRVSQDMGSTGPQGAGLRVGEEGRTSSSLTGKRNTTRSAPVGGGTPKRRK